MCWIMYVLGNNSIVCAMICFYYANLSFTAVESYFFVNESGKFAVTDEWTESKKRREDDSGIGNV